MLIRHKLYVLGACKEACDWVGNRRNIKKALRECPKKEWIEWLECTLGVCGDRKLEDAFKDFSPTKSVVEWELSLAKDDAMFYHRQLRRRLYQESFKYYSRKARALQRLLKEWH